MPAGQEPLQSDKGCATPLIGRRITFLLGQLLRPCSAVASLSAPPLLAPLGVPLLGLALSLEPFQQDSFQQRVFSSSAQLDEVEDVVDLVVAVVVS